MKNIEKIIIDYIISTINKRKIELSAIYSLLDVNNIEMTFTMDSLITVNMFNHDCVEVIDEINEIKKLLINSFDEKLTNTMNEFSIDCIIINYHINKKHHVELFNLKCLCGKNINGQEKNTYITMDFTNNTSYVHFCSKCVKRLEKIIVNTEKR